MDEKTEELARCGECGDALTKAHELAVDLCWLCGPGSETYQTMHPQYNHATDYEEVVKTIEQRRWKEDQIELSKKFKELNPPSAMKRVSSPTKLD